MEVPAPLTVGDRSSSLGRSARPRRSPFTEAAFLALVGSLLGLALASGLSGSLQHLVLPSSWLSVIPPAVDWLVPGFDAEKVAVGQFSMGASGVDRNDDALHAPAMIVNQEFVRGFLGGRGAIGREVHGWGILEHLGLRPPKPGTPPPARANRECASSPD